MLVAFSGLRDKCVCAAIQKLLHGIWPKWFVALPCDVSSTADIRFLERWAKALGVSLAALIVRILQAAIEGDQYVEHRPENDD